jgi:PPOX class probable F420-dependent enzyme
MSEVIPANFRDLFQKKAFGQFATINKDGSPQVTPVWCDFDGTYVRVNSAVGRVKDRNVRRNPSVAITLQDPDNPYRYLSVQGKVEDITLDGADDHIDALSNKYVGNPRYAGRRPGEVRVIYKIRPVRSFTMG